MGDFQPMCHGPTVLLTTHLPVHLIRRFVKGLLEAARTMSERLQEEGIKLPGGCFGHELHSDLMRQGGFITSARAQRIVYIGDGYDAGGQGDVIAGQPAWIAVAVMPLMVMAGNIDGHLQKGMPKAMFLGDLMQ